MKLFCVGLGSAVGGTARFALNQLPFEFGVGVFPVSTLIINLSGSLLIGYLLGSCGGSGAAGPHPHKWHFWMTGVCGGYTTFSAFSLQLLELIVSGHAQLAGFYAAASVGAGLIAVWIGISWALGRQATKK